jgi:transcriptional antiterminator RfaH
MSQAIDDTLSWYVVHTHPKQEERTNSNLQSFGVETLTPNLRVNKYNEFSGHLTRLVKPLFPGYIFARFQFSRLYHRIRYTGGVHSLICFNDKPISVDDEIIELLRSRIGTDGFVTTNRDLKVGDRVVIREGRFRDLYGVFEQELPDADRVRILLSTIGFQAHVVVNRAVVDKVSPTQ